MVKNTKKDYNLTFIFGIIYIVFENPVKLFFCCDFTNNGRFELIIGFEKII